MPHRRDIQTATYTGTGAQTAMTVDPASKCTIGIVAGGSDDVDLEYQVIEGGTWYKKSETIAANTLVENVGPIVGVRLNITTNTSTAVKLEVAQA